MIVACLLVAGIFAEASLYYGDVSENFVIRWAFQDHCHHVSIHEQINMCGLRNKMAELGLIPKMYSLEILSLFDR